MTDSLVDVLREMVQECRRYRVSDGEMSRIRVRAEHLLRAYDAPEQPVGPPEPVEDPPEQLWVQVDEPVNAVDEDEVDG